MPPAPSRRRKAALWAGAPGSSLSIWGDGEGEARPCWIGLVALDALIGLVWLGLVWLFALVNLAWLL